MKRCGEETATYEPRTEARSTVLPQDETRRHLDLRLLAAGTARWSISVV